MTTIEQEPKKLLAIINPISGTGRKENMPQLIGKIIDSTKFGVYVRFTERAGHASELAKWAIDNDFYGVVAVGGDGTINEVASSLIDTDVALGIVPCGSGNGLARHLQIPINAERALSIVNQGLVESLDYCTVNDRPFFCTCGVGFDAEVSAKFAEAGKRGPLTYVQQTLTEYFKYRPAEYVIELDNKVLTEKAFVIACGNASQYGNNAYIAPRASIHDGLIDVTVIHPFSPIESPVISLLLFTKLLDQNTKILSFRAPELTIHCPKEGVMHIDGEPVKMGKDLRIKCHNKGIKAFVPRLKEEIEQKKAEPSPIEQAFRSIVESVKSELDI